MVENGDVVGAESSRVGEIVTGLQHSGHGLREFLSFLTIGEELVTKAGHISVIDKVMRFQPPFAEERGDERCEETTDVDEDVEDLETGVTTLFSLTKAGMVTYGIVCSLILSVSAVLINVFKLKAGSNYEK